MKLKGLLCIILLILQSVAFGTEHCEANKVLSVTASKPEGLKNFTSFPFENDFYFVGEREREGAINFKVSLSVQRPDLTLKAPETNPVTKSTNGGVITEYEVVKTAGGEKKISGKVYLVVLSAEICETFKVDDDVVIGVSKGESENPKTKLMAEAVGADDWTATIKLMPDDKSVEILEPTELSKSSNLTNIRITKGYEFEKKETKELELSFKIKGKEVKVVKNLDLQPVEFEVPKYLCKNDNDDQKDGVKDHMQTPSTGDGDLKPVTIKGDFRGLSGKIRLEVSKGKSKITSAKSAGIIFWEDIEKKNPAKTLEWDILTEGTFTKILYLEGNAASAAKDDVELKITLDFGKDKSFEFLRQTTVYDVEIRDKNDVLMSNGRKWKVAIRDEYKAIVLPSVASPIYQWEVQGKSPANKSDAIRVYEHDIDDSSKHKIIDLTAAHHKEQTLKLFWRKDFKPNLKVIVSSGDLKCEQEVELDIGHDTDPNRNIYTKEMPDNDHNPNGEMAIYEINKDHAAWHAAHNRDRFINTQNYTGEDFLIWHKEIIDAHNIWRNTFNITAIAGGVPAGADAKHSYLTIAGGNSPSRYYANVRLGEAQNLNQAGHMTVSPWHNAGHGQLAGAGFPDMARTRTAIRSQNNTFWRWHTEIDTVRATYIALGGPDKADLSMSVPADGANMIDKTIEFTFDLPVSQKSNHPWNEAGIAISDFTLNGAALPAGTTLTPKAGDRKTYILTFTPVSGANALVFAGSLGINKFNLTVNKP